MIVKRLTPEIGNLHSIVNLTLDSTGESPTIQPLVRGAITAAINLSKFIRYTHLGNPETVRLASVAANKLGDPVLRADVLYHLAWITLSIGTSAEKLEHERLCREALALYEQNGNLNGQAGTTINVLQRFRISDLGSRMHLVTGPVLQRGQAPEGVQRVVRASPRICRGSTERVLRGKYAPRSCVKESSWKKGKMSVELVGNYVLRRRPKGFRTLESTGMAYWCIRISQSLIFSAGSEAVPRAGEFDKCRHDSVLAWTTRSLSQ